MSNDLIFKSYKGNLMNRGSGDCQFLLYCGKRYTGHNGCQCLHCDGTCGPHYGCPCPDCYYTLGFILYSTGKMICPLCQNMLRRLNIFNLIILTQRTSFACNICYKNYTKLYIPIMHCINCNYNVCPNCAFAKIDFNNLKISDNLLYIGSEGGEGMIYCGKMYCNNGKCLCGGCDGYCGKINGCPCPLCEIILGYNIYINTNLLCGTCNNTLLVKTTFIQLLKFNQNYDNEFICNICRKSYNQGYSSLFHCYTCNFDLCQVCAFNLIKSKNILYPLLPEIKKSNQEYAINNLEKKSEQMEIDEEKKDIKDSQKLEKKEEKNEKKNEKKNEDDDENMKCVICLEKNKCFLFLPCKHVPCCEECSELVTDCPICRNKIESKLKIFI